MTKSFGPVPCGGSLVEWDKTGKGPKGEQGLEGLPLGRNASRHRPGPPRWNNDPEPAGSARSSVAM
jgi:hypothetical protein